MPLISFMFGLPESIVKMEEKIGVIYHIVSSIVTNGSSAQ